MYTLLGDSGVEAICTRELTVMDAAALAVVQADTALPRWMGGALRLCAALLSAGRQLLVLTYHRVLPQADALLPDEVDAQRFEREVRLLAEHFCPVPLIEGVERLRSRSLPARAVCLTLDDGYANNCEIALPILRRYAVPATCFIATGFLDGALMWNDRIIEAVRNTSLRELDLSAAGLGVHDLSSIENRRRAIDRLLVAIKHDAPPAREQRVAHVVAATGVPPPAAQMMDARQVRIMHQAGIEIGAHTVSHPILSRLEPAEARREIEESRAQLADIVRAPVLTFAYPNGRPLQDYAAEHVRVVRGAGFALAVSTAWGAMRGSCDVFQVPRIAPWDSSAPAFGARLLRAYAQADAARA